MPVVQQIQKKKLFGRPFSYLNNRQLVYNTSSIPRLKHITLEESQGCIISPDLWNVNYDGIILQEVGYVDNVAAVIMARDKAEAQRKLKCLILRTKTG